MDEWLSIARFVLEAMIIPAVVFVFKIYSDKMSMLAEEKKRAVDLERQITGMKRDSQLKALDSKIDRNAMQFVHTREELESTLEVRKFLGSQINVEFAGVGLWRLASPVYAEMSTGEGSLCYYMTPGFPTNMRSGSHLIDWLIPKFTKNNI
jgi:hypothetical protein